MSEGLESFIEQFLLDYPGMSLAPSRSRDVILKGKFGFQAKSKNGPEIIDSYEIIISVPTGYPRELPKVTEVAKRIPRDGNHHVNPDGTLCLGSPLRLLSLISGKPDIICFAENCLVPFLYAISNKLESGGDFIFKELDHGTPGIIDDYCDLFKLYTPDQIIETLNLLGLKKRVANKKSCPCQCGSRLGKCTSGTRINRFRTLAPRSWFRKHAFELSRDIHRSISNNSVR